MESHQHAYPRSFQRGYNLPSPRDCEIMTSELQGEVGEWDVGPIHFGPSEPTGVSLTRGRFRSRRPCRWRGASLSGGRWPGGGVRPARSQGRRVNRVGPGLRPDRRARLRPHCSCGTTPLRGSEPRRPHQAAPLFDIAGRAGGGFRSPRNTQRLAERACLGSFGPEHKELRLAERACPGSFGPERKRAKLRA